MIKNIETKMRLTLIVSIGSFVTAIVICVLSFSYAKRMITAERKQIYVLDNNIPLVANHINIDNNRKAEYKAEIIQFHNLFFTLPPDNHYIEKKLNSAMYLIDESGIGQYNSLKEKGYFNNLIASSTIVTCSVDSVHIDMNTKKWTYYGKEKIERPSDVTIRDLVTTGGIEDVLNGQQLPLRTANNPYGAILIHWKTIENKDLSHVSKRIY